MIGRIISRTPIVQESGGTVYESTKTVITPSRVPGVLKDLSSLSYPRKYDAIEPELLELLHLNDDLVIMSAGLFTTNRMHRPEEMCSFGGAASNFTVNVSTTPTSP